MQLFLYDDYVTEVTWRVVQESIRYGEKVDSL